MWSGTSAPQTCSTKSSAGRSCSDITSEYYRRLPTLAGMAAPSFVIKKKQTCIELLFTPSWMFNVPIWKGISSHFSPYFTLLKFIPISLSSSSSSALFSLPSALTPPRPPLGLLLDILILPWNRGHWEAFCMCINQHLFFYSELNNEHAVTITGPGPFKGFCNKAQEHHPKITPWDSQGQ